MADPYSPEEVLGDPQAEALKEELENWTVVDRTEIEGNVVYLKLKRKS